jgi:hypothetical protein
MPQPMGQKHQYLLDFLLQHKERALMILATMIMIMMCVVIQMMPTKNNKGLSSMAQIHMCSYGCH